MKRCLVVSGMSSECNYFSCVDESAWLVKIIRYLTASECRDFNSGID